MPDHILHLGLQIVKISKVDNFYIHLSI